MKQVIILIAITVVLGILERAAVHGTPTTRTCLGSPRTLGSIAGAPGTTAPLLGCSASSAAVVVLTGALRFGPRSSRFDQIFPKGKFGTVSKNTIEIENEFVMYFVV